MKHKLKITFLLLFLFILIQLIGLFVVSYYKTHELPYGFSMNTTHYQSNNLDFVYSIIFGIILVVLTFLFLKKFKLNFFLKLWFFFVVGISIAISLNSILFKIPYFKLISLVIAFALTFFKIYKRNILVHNFTELLVYPGIAVIFIPFLNLFTLLILLVLISLYDMWAVWHSGIRQKMAKYQIDELKIFPGFFIPYISKKIKIKIKKLKKSKLKNKKIKVRMAVLGGGDIVFSIISAGVVYVTTSVKLPFGLLPFNGGLVASLFVIAGTTLGLSYLLFFGKEKKFYPAMPFISLGILFMLILYYLFSWFPFSI